MDVLRKNTDYGLRAMVSLSGCYDERLVSARELSDQGNFSYQLGRKILQRLHKAGLVESVMGPKGGFRLSRKPTEITLYDVINALQGGIRMNKCLMGGEGCEFSLDCGVNVKLSGLQIYIEDYLGGITMQELVRDQRMRNNRMEKLTG